MISRIIDWCAGNRFLVFTGTVVLTLWGIWAMTVTPLDAAFGALGLDASNDAAFGVRFTGAMTDRYAVEVSLDVLPGAAAFTGTLASAVEATRASFVPAFETSRRLPRASS